MDQVLHDDSELVGGTERWLGLYLGRSSRFRAEPIAPSLNLRSPILEDLVKFSAILVRDFFLRLVFPPRLGFLSSPRDAGGRLRWSVPVEQLGDVAPEEPEQERNNPDNDRGENEKKEVSQPPGFFASLLRHWGLIA